MGQKTRCGGCRLKKGEGRHEIREGGCKLKEGEERQETRDKRRVMQTVKGLLKDC